MTDEIELPQDNRKSRLDRAPKSEVLDEEIVRAADRFKKFRTAHKDGFHDAILERIIEHPDGHVTYVVVAHVWKVKGSGSPDATAWAQGSTKDTNPIIAASPLESADTIARSRALRNLGILPEPRKKAT